MRGSSNAQADLSSKQDTLTFDTIPTANSTNPITSGGVYTALESAGGDWVIYTGSLLDLTDSNNDYELKQDIIWNLVITDGYTTSSSPVLLHKGVKFSTGWNAVYGAASVYVTGNPTRYVVATTLNLAQSEANRAAIKYYTITTNSESSSLIDVLRNASVSDITVGTYVQIWVKDN